jgi:hypothetical protein
MAGMPGTPGMAAGAPGAMPAMDARMKSMQEMHQKMMGAKTPAERQALMADHMKAMQDGMAMMKEMQATHGAGGMGDGKKTADPMAMMQMMMDMMNDRMPPAAINK